MSKKIRIKMCTDNIQKKKHVQTITEYNGKQISYERSKKGQYYILFSIKGGMDLSKFQAFAIGNSLKYEICQQ